MTDADKDSELLNAYHDGELSAHDASEVRRRLAQEPELRRELEAIADISAALKPLRPRLHTATAPRLKRERFWFAAAAVFAVAAFLTYESLTTPVQAPFNMHREFLSRVYPAPSDTVVTPVAQWIGGEPDLSSANLTLVDVATMGSDQLYLHYSGVNGCRLTFGAHLAEPVMPEPTDSLLLHIWRSEGIHYSLIAEGMDRAKFAAIRALLEERTMPEEADDLTVLAVRDATANAVPCA